MLSGHHWTIFLLKTTTWVPLLDSVNALWMLFWQTPFPPVSKQKCALRGAFLFVSTIQPTNHRCHWSGLGWTSSDTLQSFVPLSCGIALDDVVPPLIHWKCDPVFLTIADPRGAIYWHSSLELVQARRKTVLCRPSGRQQLAAIDRV